MASQYWKNQFSERARRVWHDPAALLEIWQALPAERQSWAAGQFARQLPSQVAIEVLQHMPSEPLVSSEGGLSALARQAIRRAGSDEPEVLFWLLHRPLNPSPVLAIWREIVHSIPSDEVLNQAKSALLQLQPALKSRMEETQAQMPMPQILERVLLAPHKLERAFDRYGLPSEEQVLASLRAVLQLSTGQVSGQSVARLTELLSPAFRKQLGDGKETILDYAARSERWEALSALVQALDTSTLTENQKIQVVAKAAASLLQRAPSVEAFEEFVKAASPVKGWAQHHDAHGSLIHAALRASPRKLTCALVERLIDEGAPVHASTSGGVNPLHFLASLLSANLLKQSQQGQIWALLIQRGLDAEAKSFDHPLPLSPLQIIAKRDKQLVEPMRIFTQQAALECAVPRAPGARNRM